MCYACNALYYITVFVWYQANSGACLQDVKIESEEPCFRLSHLVFWIRYPPTMSWKAAAPLGWKEVKLLSGCGEQFHCAFSFHLTRCNPIKRPGLSSSPRSGWVSASSQMRFHCRFFVIHADRRSLKHSSSNPDGGFLRQPTSYC